jgi:MoaA/NifB/PqqE/SkfB family radical SAM enzyme
MSLLFFYGQWQKLTRFNKYFSVEQWVDAWHRIYKKYGSTHIIVSGGEPTIYPSFFDLVKELSREHTLEIITNLSCSQSQLVNFIKQLQLNRVHFSTSFHSLFTSFEVFLKKVLIIKERGLFCVINLVAYPPELKRMSYFKDKFTKYGFDISILPFRGIHSDTVYPEGYTEAEKSIIYNLSGSLPPAQKKQLDQFMSLDRTKGKLCYAGQKYARINSDGHVVRCAPSKKILGYFFDREISLLDHPSPCVSEKCFCEFMWLVKDN